MHWVLSEPLQGKHNVNLVFFFFSLDTTKPKSDTPSDSHAAICRSGSHSTKHHPDDCVQFFTGYSISIWKVVSAHWAALSWPCRQSEAAPLLPFSDGGSHRFDSVLKAGVSLNNGGSWKNHYPRWILRKLLTYMHVRHLSALFSSLFSLAVLHGSADGEQTAGRALWAASQWEYAGSSPGDSCCLSLHFLSKATYLTPPLQHRNCQVTTPAHPLHYAQPLTWWNKSQMTNVIQPENACCCTENDTYCLKLKAVLVWNIIILCYFPGWVMLDVKNGIFTFNVMLFSLIALGRFVATHSPPPRPIQKCSQSRERRCSFHQCRTQQQSMNVGCLQWLIQLNHRLQPEPES